jgi:hypothetical protein
MQASHFHNGEAYHLAGWDGTYHFYDVWRTANGDPGNEWKRIYGPTDSGDNIFTRRSYVLAQSYNGELHFVGGYNPGFPGNVIRDHWSTKDGKQWSRWQQPGWEAREAYGLTVMGDKMYLSGGVTYSNPDPGYHLRAFADVWAFDVNGDWTLVLDDAPWGKRRSHGWEYLNGYLWLWCGYNSQNELQSDLWRWDGINPPEQMTSFPCPARGSFISCVVNNQLIMMGGTLDAAGDIQTNEIWSYSPVADSWTKHSTPPWDERFGTRALVAGNTIYVIGGAKGAGSSRIFYGDVWSTSDLTTWTHETNSTLDV